MGNERLRIVLEFNKGNIEDLKLYEKLVRFSHPAAIIKDILKGVIPILVIDGHESRDVSCMGNERLRIVLEFNKGNIEDLKLYKKLIKFSHPAAIIKDILKGVIPITIIDGQVSKDED